MSDIQNDNQNPVTPLDHESPYPVDIMEAQRQQMVAIADASRAKRSAIALIDDIKKRINSGEELADDAWDKAYEGYAFYRDVLAHRASEAKAKVEAKEKAEQEAKEKAEAEAKAKAEAEAQAKADKAAAKKTGE